MGSGILKDDAQGFEENKSATIKGGTAAGDALDAFEQRTGDKVVSSQNYKGSEKNKMEISGELFCRQARRENRQ